MSVGWFPMPDFITVLFAFFVVMFAASNSDQKKAGKIAQAVQVAFKEMNSVHLAEDSRGLTVSMAEAGFFDPGSAAMNPQALIVIDRIAATMRPLGYNLRVEGHTDNIPIHTAQFPSN